tara:strand:- start:561 stop:683 length:123 start_codon:yes stop_codon:yes gene_type:complete
MVEVIKKYLGRFQTQWWNYPWVQEQIEHRMNLIIKEYSKK